MSNTRSQRPDETWLQKYMHELGYRARRVCVGLSYAAAQALWADGANGLRVLQQRAKRIERLAGENNLAIDVDLRAFFDTIEMRSEPDIYSVNLLGFDYTLSQSRGLWFTLPFLLPSNLDREAKNSNQRVQNVYSETAAFTLSELKDYFHVLGEKIRASKFNFRYPVTMTLAHTDHCIMVAYLNNQWILVDEAAWLLDNKNNFIRFFDNDAEIANAVHSALGSSEVCVFSNKAYATNSNASASKKLFSDFAKDAVHASAYKNQTNIFGASILHVAAMYGDMDALRVGIAHGADLNQRDILGQTPLHAAVQAGDLEMVKMLVEANADIDMQNLMTGHTALIIASWSGYAEIAKYLVDKGADQECTCLDGKNAYEYAEQYHREKVLAHLKEPDGDFLPVFKRNDL